MQGLGDNIYQRAIVRALAERWSVYLCTSWPQLYADLPVRLVRAVTRLRTQAKNVKRWQGRWDGPPHRSHRARIAYGHKALAEGGIVQAMERCASLPEGGPLRWDLPRFEAPAWSLGKRIAFVRPVTVRKEWRNEARNPDPLALRLVSEALAAAGLHVVSVADLVSGHEWLVEPAPFAHTVLHRGELSVEEMLGLFQRSEVALGGVGWIVPAAVASGTPLFVIGGGMGGHNAPEVVLDPRMEVGHIGWLLPDDYCRCTSHHHACNKRISSNVVGAFEQWWAVQATRSGFARAAG